MICERCERLEDELEATRQALDEANARAANATDLMMKGEALRDKMMRESILGGQTIDEKKARVVYILTGKEL